MIEMRRYDDSPVFRRGAAGRGRVSTIVLFALTGVPADRDGARIASFRGETGEKEKSLPAYTPALRTAFLKGNSRASGMGAAYRRPGRFVSVEGHGARVSIPVRLDRAGPCPDAFGKEVAPHRRTRGDGIHMGVVWARRRS